MVPGTSGIPSRVLVISNCESEDAGRWSGGLSALLTCNIDGKVVIDMPDEATETLQGPERESPIMDGITGLRREAGNLRARLRVVLKPSEAVSENKPPESNSRVLSVIADIGEILQEIDERLLL